MTGIFQLLTAALGFFMATALFWAGIAFEHRPAGWPNIPVNAGPFHIVIHLPDSPYVLLDKLKDAEATAEAHAKAVEAQNAQMSAKIGQNDQQAEAAIQIRYQTIEKEVPHVVTPEIDRNYPLPVGFVRLWNAGAQGVDVSSISDPSGRSDDAPSGVALSTAGAALIDNDRDCRAVAQRLIDLQAWASSISKPLASGDSLAPTAHH